jgi:hypothetical protein
VRQKNKSGHFFVLHFFVRLDLVAETMINATGAKNLFVCLWMNAYNARAFDRPRIADRRRSQRAKSRFFFRSPDRV